MMEKYDYLIVGAGLFGSVFAYEANKRGKKCLVIEKRDHIGGNVYTENTFSKKVFIKTVSDNLKNKYRKTINDEIGRAHV